MQLFGRQASVVIVPAKGIVYDNKITRTGIDLTGLRTVFQVTKSNDPTANSAQVALYNLSQDTITFSKQKQMQLILSVGYDGGGSNPQLKVIFSGDIFRTSTNKQDGGLVTKFENADSLKALQVAQVNKAYKTGTPVSALLDEITKNMGLAQGNVQGVKGKAFTAGYSAIGSARNQLDVIAQKTDTVWSIQDGAIQFIPAQGNTPESIIVLTSNTGLIGSPNQKVVDVAGLKLPGIEAISLLQPEIKPGRRVEIDSQFVSGVYVVQKVTHRGDTRSGPWYSEIEAIPSKI